MKKIKTITIILAIILVTMVSFAGVYIKKQNRMENKVKEYILGRELKGERVIELNVATAEGTKPAEEDMTIENYNIVKNTIENRMRNIRKIYSSVLGDIDYTISLNKENGNIRVELPDDNNTDLYAYFLTADSKVNIKEKDTTTELLSDSMVEGAEFTYTANMEGAYQTYLMLHLTDEGQAKIEEIKNNYAVLAKDVEEAEAAAEKTKKEEEKTEGEATTTEENKPEETVNRETKKIAILTVAGSEYDIDKIEKNIITVKIGGQTTNQSSINNNLNMAVELAMLVNSGKYPINYEIRTNRFENSNLENQYMSGLIMALIVVSFTIMILYTIQYKFNGLLGGISSIGLISILLLILRYTNVAISIEGIGAIILILVMNINVVKALLKDVNNIEWKKMILNIIPTIIISLVFSFSGCANLSSFGLIMFWGLVLIALYNITVTKTLLKLRESK